jgi:hypothetical protein
VLGALRDRVLLQVGAKGAGQVREHLDSERSGLVLSGPGAVRKAMALRNGEGFTGALLVDPAVYETCCATGEEPFPQVEDGTFGFADPLGVSLAEQRAAGVSAVLTPTGYVRADDTAALRAAVRRTRELGDPAVILAVPVDVAWLRTEAVGELVAALGEYDGVKAVMLGGQRDPLARFPDAVGNLCRLIADVPGTAVLRTDLAAFGALAHGAAFAAFGVSGRYRHIVPPWERPQAFHAPVRSPHVLFPDLMAFFLGSTIANRFAAAAAPLCPCPACRGNRALDTFTDVRGTMRAEAAAHNVATLMDWLGRLTDLPPGVPRRRWWHARCRAAVDRYALVNAEIRQPNGFTAPPQLKRWAVEPPR